MLTEYERQILGKIDRGEPIEWGAAVGQALEVLRGHGLIRWTTVSEGEITEAGRRALSREAPNG